MSDQDIGIYVRIHESELYKKISAQLTSREINPEAIERLMRIVPEKIGKRYYRPTLIMVYALYFDKRTTLLNLNLRSGARVDLARILNTSKENASKLYTIARTRYRCLPKFREIVDRYLNDMLNA